MGYYAIRVVIRGKRSAHNSIDDKLDMARWEYLTEWVRGITTHPDFERLAIEVEGPDEC